MNLTLAFLLELALLYALGAWGFNLNASTGVQWVVGIALPLAVVVVWALWLAPRATRRLSPGWLAMVKIVLFTLGALALRVTAGDLAAALFEAVVLLNLLLDGAPLRLAR